MMRLKDLADLQKGYASLIAGKMLTKRALCDLVILFRDKYGLTDKQALMAARKEYPLFQLCELMSKPKPMTNAEYIRSMSDEELLKFIYGIYDKDRCDFCPLGTSLRERGYCTGEFCEENRLMNLLPTGSNSRIRRMKNEL